MKPILAATDLSERSAHVAGRGARLAHALGAPLILAHVQREAGKDSQAAQTALDHTARACGAEARLVIGHAAQSLAQIARDTDAQLAVLGLHRERRALDALRLTTMEQIVLDLPCPVLIAHTAPERPYRQVLAITDFSPASAHSLAEAARIAPDARFHAIHALAAPLGALFSAKAKAERLTQAEARRDAFMQTPGLPRLDEPVEIVEGGVHEVLDFRRTELDADLVCLGVHSGRNPRVLGNYARDLMRAPPTDLLLGRPPRAAAAAAEDSETAAAG